MGILFLRRLLILFSFYALSLLLALLSALCSAAAAAAAAAALLHTLNSKLCQKIAKTSHYTLPEHRRYTLLDTRDDAYIHALNLSQIHDER